jgi:hypothetical protein
VVYIYIYLPHTHTHTHIVYFLCNKLKRCFNVFAIEEVIGLKFGLQQWFQRTSQAFQKGRFYKNPIHLGHQTLVQRLGWKSRVKFMLEH